MDEQRRKNTRRDVDLLCLPDELLRKSFLSLKHSPSDIRNVMLVCSRFCQLIVADDRIWGRVLYLLSLNRAWIVCQLSRDNETLYRAGMALLDPNEALRRADLLLARVSSKDCTRIDCTDYLLCLDELTYVPWIRRHVDLTVCLECRMFVIKRPSTIEGRCPEHSNDPDARPYDCAFTRQLILDAPFLNVFLEIIVCFQSIWFPTRRLNTEILTMRVVKLQDMLGDHETIKFVGVLAVITWGRWAFSEHPLEEEGKKQAMLRLGTLLECLFGTIARHYIQTSGGPGSVMCHVMSGEMHYNLDIIKQAFGSDRRCLRS